MVRWGGSGQSGGQGVCEQRIEVIVLIQKRGPGSTGGPDGGKGGSGRGGGGQGGCVRRIEVIVKMQKRGVAGGCKPRI